MQYDLLIRSISGFKDVKWIELSKRLENHQNMVGHYPPFWRLYSQKLSLLKINFNWQFLDFSSGASPAVPISTPGIYLFVLKPEPSIFDSYNLIMYVGMTDDGLIERLNTGYRMPSTLKNRPNIHRLILDYGRFLLWYYLPLPGKSKKELKEIETNLIGFFNDPPINKKDAPFEIAEANKSKMV
jgi:hypothetical protein